MTIQTVVRKALSPYLYVSGYYRRRWQRLARITPCVVVVCYHRIRSSSGDAEGSLFGVERGLPQKIFEAQLRFLLQHFEPIALSQLIDDQRSLPPLAFAVTFDDAYQDTLTVAAPVLKSLGIPAAVYVPSGFVESDRLFWWEQLGSLLRGTQETTLRLDDALSPWQARFALPPSLAIDTHRNRERAFDLLSWRLFMRLAPAQIPTVLDRLAKVLQTPLQTAGRSRPLLSWAELRELKTFGFEIGAHGVTHAHLGLSSVEDIRREVHQSVAAIEKNLGEPVHTFAYPYGNCSTPAIQAVKHAGCRIAFAGGPGVIRPGADPFTLPRIGLNRPWKFAIAYTVNEAFESGS